MTLFLSTPWSLGWSRSVAAGSMAVAAAFTAMPAHAGLLGDSLTVSLLSPSGLLSDPTALSFIDNVVASGSTEISAGNGTSIGTFMLAGTDAQGTNIVEFIDIMDTSIRIRLLAGDEVQGVGVTGYASGAKYVFSGLNSSAGTITSINVAGSAADIVNFGSLSSWASLENPNQISFALDAIQFVAKTGADFADITINLVTSNDPPPGVPEPGSIALAGLAMLALWGSRRRLATNA